MTKCCIGEWNYLVMTLDIRYRPGSGNISPDAFARSHCNDQDRLISLQKALCQPGVTRVYHFVKPKNTRMPYSVENVLQVTISCKKCVELKPNFHNPEKKTILIKATQPFERLNVDLNGPLPVLTRTDISLTT